MYNSIQEIINKLDFNSISQKRIKELGILINYIQKKHDKNTEINLNFICTHNSRRSQLSQLWAKVAADYNHIHITSLSGGIEVTAFNARAIASLKRFGFDITNNELKNNSVYSIKWDDTAPPLLMFSKLFDNKVNLVSSFAAIMTCAHADENCPFIPETEARIPIRYNDPKEFDNTPLEAKMYDTRSLEIATEFFYIFSRIK